MDTESERLSSTCSSAVVWLSIWHPVTGPEIWGRADELHTAEGVCFQFISSSRGRLFFSCTVRGIVEIIWALFIRMHFISVFKLIFIVFPSPKWVRKYPRN